LMLIERSEQATTTKNLVRFITPSSSQIHAHGVSD
jgi:hypothetical protein